MGFRETNWACIFILILALLTSLGVSASASEHLDSVINYKDRIIKLEEELDLLIRNGQVPASERESRMAAIPARVSQDIMESKFNADQANAAANIKAFNPRESARYYVKPTNDLPFFEADNFGRYRYSIYRTVDIAQRSSAGTLEVMRAWVKIGDTSTIDSENTGPAYLDLVDRANEYVSQNKTIPFRKLGRFNRRSGNELILTFLPLQISCLERLNL